MVQKRIISMIMMIMLCCVGHQVVLMMLIRRARNLSSVMKVFIKRFVPFPAVGMSNLLFILQI